jgi:hypothetical protein
LPLGTRRILPTATNWLRPRQRYADFAARHEEDTRRPWRSYRAPVEARPTLPLGTRWMLPDHDELAAPASTRQRPCRSARGGCSPTATNWLRPRQRDTGFAARSRWIRRNRSPRSKDHFVALALAKGVASLRNK